MEATEQEQNNQPVIHDHNNVVYKICVLIGIGMILPWNAVLSAFDFFTLTLSHYNPAFSFTFAMNSPNALMQMVVVKWGYKFSLSLRMITTFLGCMLLLVLIPLFTAFIDQDIAYYLDIAVVILMGFMMAILQASVFGMTGMMPGKYTAASMTGMGLSGTMIGVVRVIILFIWPDVTNKNSNDALLGAIVYFVISAIVSLSCVVGFIHLIKQPFSEYHLNRDSYDSKFNDSFNSTDSPGPRPSTNMILRSPKAISVRRMLKKTGGSEMKFRPQSLVHQQFTLHIDEGQEGWVPRSHGNHKDNGLADEVKDTHEGHLGDTLFAKQQNMKYRKLTDERSEEEHPEASSEVYNDYAPQKESEDIQREQNKPPAFFELMRSLFGIWLAVMLIFVQTFACFPGLTLDASFSFWDQTWYSVSIVLLFNIFDTVGRYLPNFLVLFNVKTIWIPVIIRFVFIFTFLYIAGDNTTPHWLFHSDWFIIVNMIIFAISNGYLCTLCMIYGPLQVPQNARETAGYIMSFGLVLGIFLGSMISNFGLSKINLSSL